MTQQQPQRQPQRKSQRIPRDLGPLLTRIAGPQFYTAQAAPGEEIYLERDPENRHDANAFRLDNLDFEPIGHLPRRTASWLAPLVDAGKLVPKAIAVGKGSTARKLELSLHVTSRGRYLLHRRRDPKSAEEAVHNLIVQAFRDASRHGRPEHVRGLAMHLAKLQSRHLLPASHMLLALLPSLARPASGSDLATSLSALDPGPAGPLGDLIVFPLLPTASYQPAQGLELLASAIEKGTAEVREVSEQGSVGNLVICNHGPLPLLAPEGEILLGAKQDRMLQYTVIAPAHSELTVQVCCVERGRWRRTSNRFRAGSYAPLALRHTMQKERQDDPENTQVHTWTAVDSYLDQVGTVSSTSKVSDGLDKVRSDRQKPIELPSLPPEALGVAAVRAGEILALDLFATPGAFQAQWPRLAEGYVAGASAPATSASPSPDLAKAFLAHLAQSAQPASEQTGLGTRYDIDSPRAAGSVLLHEGAICHLAAQGPASQIN